MYTRAQGEVTGRRCVRLFTFSSVRVRFGSEGVSDEPSSRSDDKPSRGYALPLQKKLRVKFRKAKPHVREFLLSPLPGRQWQVQSKWVVT
jgi:hypothetical protein